MKVNKKVSALSLKLGLNNGLVDGKIKVKNKSYKNIRPTAEDEDLYLLGEALGSLNERELLELTRVEESTLEKVK